MNFIKSAINNLKMRLYYGSEDTYFTKVRETNGQLTMQDMAKQEGEDWLKKGSLMTVYKYGISGASNNGEKVTFWTPVKYETFETAIKLFVSSNGTKIQTIPIYRMSDDFYPRFKETTLMLNSVTEYGKDNTKLSNLISLQLKQEEYNQYKTEIEEGKILLSDKDKKKVTKELKKYEDYKNFEYVYKDFWMPGVMEERGFPQNKYACLDLDELDNPKKPKKEKLGNKVEA